MAAGVQLRVTQTQKLGDCLRSCFLIVFRECLCVCVCGRMCLAYMRPVVRSGNGNRWTLGAGKRWKNKKAVNACKTRTGITRHTTTITRHNKNGQETMRHICNNRKRQELLRHNSRFTNNNIYKREVGSNKIIIHDQQYVLHMNG